VDELATRYKSTGTDITFDKDDECVMLFVAVAANLRSYIYHIKPESLFEAKCKPSCELKSGCANDSYQRRQEILYPR